MNTLNTRNIYTGGHPYSIWFPYKKPNDFNGLCLSFGKGIYLYDIYGKKYIDLASGLWNVSLGYGNKRIIDAITQQAGKLAYCSLFENSNELLLSGALQLTEFMKLKGSKVIYSCSGSESLETAIKVMRQYWSLQGQEQKRIILSFSDSYHGTSYGAMSISDLEKPEFCHIGPMLDMVTTIQAKYKTSGCICSNCQEICEEWQELKSFIEKNCDRIAGIVIEPMLSSKGAFSLCREYLIHLVDLCKKYHVLVAFDEVATGFYRCGTRFYYLKLGVTPDIVCLSKAINSGYLPLGATVVSEKIIKAYDNGNSILPHGSTQGGNLLACAAMKAALEQYAELETIEDFERKGNQFYGILKSKLEGLRCIKQIRGDGLFFSLDLNRKNILSVKQLLENRGIIVYYSDVGLLLLPMIITTLDEWKNIVNRIYYVLREIG